MTTTQDFLINFKKIINQKGQNLIIEFFITFSRFECALKASNFTNGNNDRVTANWDTFVGTITTFNENKTTELKNAVDYLIQNPPRIQCIDSNGLLGWRNRNFQNEPQINKLSLSIRDVRNNLFHGGKFNGHYEEDVSRNSILLKSSLLILDEWLELNALVKQNYLSPFVQMN